MKILYYNRNLIFDKDQIQLLRYHNIIKQDISDEYISLFQDANFFFNPAASFIDRTGANEFFISMVISKIPKDKNNFNKSFKQLCHERAIQLIKTGKKINIMWSGGLDSTTVLFSLLKNANDLSQLRVILTPDSIAESGNLFDLHIKDKIDFVLEPKRAKKYFYEKPQFENFNVDKELITSGSLSDDLNSIIRLKIPYEEQYWHLNYEEVLSKYTNKKIIDFLNKSVKAFPKEIKTYKDFLKFYGFNFHWHKEKYYILTGMDQKYFSCYKSFFDTDEFQKWSIWNNESDIMPNILKKPQRDMLYELTEDKIYSYDKGKGMAGPGLHEQNDWFFLLENGYTFRHKDLTNDIYNDIKEKNA